MWRFLLDRNIGAINSYLGAIGLPDDTAWLSSIPAAWVALIGVTVLLSVVAHGLTAGPLALRYGRARTGRSGGQSPTDTAS